MTSAKRNKIAPISIFTMLYISRIVVSLTNAQSVTTGLLYKPDILISILAAMGITLVLCVPIVYCYKTNKNPLDIKWLAFFYGIYFVFLAALNVSRFSYFASTTFNPDSQAWMFSILIILCSSYCACIGIEGLSRFSSFAFVLLVMTILTMFFCNLKNYNEVDLYPIIQNDTDDIFKNMLLITSQTSELGVFLCLYKKTNGDCVKPFIWSITAAFLTIFLLFVIVIGVMGASASLHSFPIYTMFQMAKFGSFERIDIIHISFWIFGIFIKTVLLIYCASICIKPFKNRVKCIVASVFVLLISFVITNAFQSGVMSPVFIAVPFCIFCIVIPIATLIFKKRNFGDELVEKF